MKREKENLYFIGNVADFVACNVDYEWMHYQASTNNTHKEKLIQRLLSNLTIHSSSSHTIMAPKELDSNFSSSITST